MILNNYLTMRHIGAIRHMPLSMELVLEIYRLVTDETMKDPRMAGTLRTPLDRIVVSDLDGNNIYTSPPADELPARMEKLVDLPMAKPRISLFTP